MHRFKWILTFAGAAAVVLLLRGCVFTSCLIPSTGMEETLLQGERILVNQWSYGRRMPFMSFFDYHRWRERPVQRHDIVLFNHPADLQQPVIDRRRVYISRCIGLPGDTLLVDSLFDVVPTSAPYDMEERKPYAYPASQEELMDSLLHRLSIPCHEWEEDELQDSTHIRHFNCHEYYRLKRALGSDNRLHPLRAATTPEAYPLIVPGKGSCLQVLPWNITLLRNTLVMHEERQAEIKNDTLYVDGKPTHYCCFTKNYYWMSSNNTQNLCDSRLFGFVPQDHLIGKSILIWFSKEQGTGMWEGYRWDRMFQTIK